MRRALAFVPLALATFSNTVAHADIVGANEKPVTLSIRVDADVPAGQTVILGRTWQIIDVIKPGTVAPVEWSPIAPRMYLAVLPTSALTNLEQLKQEGNGKAIKEILQQSKPCHEGFFGFRIIPRSAPADVVRWNYRVTFEGEKCTATLASMQFFDKAGAEVEPRDFPNLPRGVLVGAPGSARPIPPSLYVEPTKSDEAESSPEPEPTQASKSSCGCRVGPGADEVARASLIEQWGPLGSLAIFALALRMRRTAARKRAGV